MTVTDHGRRQGDRAAPRTSSSFHLEDGLPVWTYEVDGVALREARADAVPPEHHTHHLPAAVGRTRAPGAASARRVPVARSACQPPGSCSVSGECLRRSIRDRARRRPPAAAALRLRQPTRRSRCCRTIFGPVAYALELHRGYEACGELWSPGYLRLTLGPDSPGTLVASTESWETIGALDSAELQIAEASPATASDRNSQGSAGRRSIAAELVLAADQFIITPAGRVPKKPHAPARRATRCGPSLPAITGSPTGAATR